MYTYSTLHYDHFGLRLPVELCWFVANPVRCTSTFSPGVDLAWRLRTKFGATRLSY